MQSTRAKDVEFPVGQIGRVRSSAASRLNHSAASPVDDSSASAASAAPFSSAPDGSSAAGPAAPRSSPLSVQAQAWDYLCTTGIIDPRCFSIQKGHRKGFSEVRVQEATQWVANRLSQKMRKRRKANDLHKFLFSLKSKVGERWVITKVFLKGSACAAAVGRLSIQRFLAPIFGERRDMFEALLKDLSLTYGDLDFQVKVLSRKKPGDSHQLKRDLEWLREKVSSSSPLKLKKSAAGIFPGQRSGANKIAFWSMETGRGQPVDLTAFQHMAVPFLFYADSMKLDITPTLIGLQSRPSGKLRKIRVAKELFPRWAISLASKVLFSPHASKINYWGLARMVLKELKGFRSVQKGLTETLFVNSGFLEGSRFVAKQLRACFADHLKGNGMGQQVFVLRLISLTLKYGQGHRQQVVKALLQCYFQFRQGAGQSQSLEYLLYQLYVFAQDEDEQRALLALFDLSALHKLCLAEESPAFVELTRIEGQLYFSYCSSDRSVSFHREVDLEHALGLILKHIPVLIARQPWGLEVLIRSFFVSRRSSSSTPGFLEILAEEIGPQVLRRLLSQLLQSPTPLLSVLGIQLSLSLRSRPEISQAKFLCSAFFTSLGSRVWDREFLRDQLCQVLQDSGDPHLVSEAIALQALALQREPTALRNGFTRSLLQQGTSEALDLVAPQLQGLPPKLLLEACRAYAKAQRWESYRHLTHLAAEHGHFTKFQPQEDDVRHALEAAIATGFAHPAHLAWCQHFEGIPEGCLSSVHEAAKGPSRLAAIVASMIHDCSDKRLIPWVHPLIERVAKPSARVHLKLQFLGLLSRSAAWHEVDPQPLPLLDAELKTLVGADLQELQAKDGLKNQLRCYLEACRQQLEPAEFIERCDTVRKKFRCRRDLVKLASWGAFQAYYRLHAYPQAASLIIALQPHLKLSSPRLPLLEQVFFQLLPSSPQVALDLWKLFPLENHRQKLRGPLLAALARIEQHERLPVEPCGHLQRVRDLLEVDLAKTAASHLRKNWTSLTVGELAEFGSCFESLLRRLQAQGHYGEILTLLNLIGTASCLAVRDFATELFCVMRAESSDHLTKKVNRAFLRHARIRLADALGASEQAQILALLRASPPGAKDLRAIWRLAKERGLLRPQRPPAGKCQCSVKAPIPAPCRIDKTVAAKKVKRSKRPKERRPKKLSPPARKVFPGFSVKKDLIVIGTFCVILLLTTLL